MTPEFAKRKVFAVKALSTVHRGTAARRPRRRRSRGLGPGDPRCRPGRRGQGRGHLGRLPGLRLAGDARGAARGIHEVPARRRGRRGRLRPRRACPGFAGSPGSACSRSATSKTCRSPWRERRQCERRRPISATIRAGGARQRPDCRLHRRYDRLGVVDDGSRRGRSMADLPKLRIPHPRRRRSSSSARASPSPARSSGTRVRGAACCRWRPTFCSVCRSRCRTGPCSAGCPRRPGSSSCSPGQRCPGSSCSRSPSRSAATRDCSIPAFLLVLATVVVSSVDRAARRPQGARGLRPIALFVAFIALGPDPRDLADRVGARPVCVRPCSG